MANAGFAIRCPCCRRWSTYNEIPMNAAVDSVEEFNALMARFQAAKPDRQTGTFEGKLFFCNSPDLLCPAPFQAIVYRGENQELEDLHIPESWSFTRHFRLYKTDTRTRWDNEKEGKYCGVLFNTQPVQRLLDIELDSLMNRELMSRLIAGMCAEIDTPLTFFAAKIFDPKDRNTKPEVYWVPIEGYSQEKKLFPPRYSLFCQTCRDISMRKLVQEFEEGKDNKYTIEKCRLAFVKKGRCGGREAVCMREPADPDNCPAFLEQRKTKCPCYNSDLALINRVEEQWRERRIPKDGVSHVCHAGFHEVAFPIEVHGRLVGIAITGQLFFQPEEIKDAHAFVKSKKVDGLTVDWETLVGEEDALDQARQIMIGLELKNRKEAQKTVFLVNQEQMAQKIDCLLPNLDRFEKSAESHYKDFRTKSEFASCPTKPEEIL